MNFIFILISLLCAVLVSGAINTKINTYRGCYEYSSLNSLVSEHHTSDNNTLTPATCMKTCAEKGFSFAGLEKDTCHCGSHSPSDLLKRSKSECNIPCPGDKTKNCGGKSKICLYETGAPIKEFLPSRIYLGCFLDNVDAYRVLKGSAVHFTNDLTHERCHQHCYSTGFRYFGLTYVKECWCGDTAPAPERLKDESECDSICSGNSKERCGGSWRTAIFATGIPDHSENGRFISCYRSAQAEVKVEYQVNLPVTGTNRRCLNLCYERNFKYAGIQNKSMCTCMNVTPHSFFIDDDYNCIQEACPGDSGDKCGTKNLIRIFRTRHGDTADLDSEAKLLGCYQDQERYRNLDGGKIESIDRLIPALCIDICKTRGFEFAGVEGGNECYCSHTYPTRYSRVDNDECKVPCTGSSNSDCGGVLRVSVFSTGFPRRQAIVNKWYLGCYKDDDQNNRMFRGQYNLFEDNSPDICHRHCLKIGYAYFGVTYYRECFCGDEDPWADLLLSDNECLQECNGDSNQKCGGSWRLSVYRTGIFDIPQNQTETLGCFKNDGSLLADRKIELPWSNLPNRCTNICDYLGYAYAGVERAIECRCGNRAPKGLVTQADSNCGQTCPGFSGNKCGGTKHTKIMRTTIPENLAAAVNPDPITSRIGNCKASDTTYNGKEVCKNLSLLNDDFQHLNTTIWSGTKKMALDPDYEFVTYTTSPDVLYVKKGILFIKPKIQSPEFVQGSLKIENCTGKLNTEECSKTVQSSNILPPINSAQITTKSSLTFRFGRMEIRAKLPSGDWIVPEIWLSPRDNSYGPDYQSGQIRIAMVRGNSELTCGSEKLGNRYLQAGLYFGPRNGIKKILFTKEMPADWLTKFHDFSIVWTTDNLSFYVDGALMSSVLKNPSDTVRTVAQIPPNVEYLWRDGTRLAPFDKEFYLTLGVSVGGINDFLDNCVSNGVKKPWTNTSPKAMANFWQKRTQWSSTWKDEESALQIDHIRLNAIS